MATKSPSRDQFHDRGAGVFDRDPDHANLAEKAARDDTPRPPGRDRIQDHAPGLTEGQGRVQMAAAIAEAIAPHGDPIPVADHVLPTSDAKIRAHAAS